MNFLTKIRTFFYVYTCRDCGYHAADNVTECENCGSTNVWNGTR